MMKHTKEPAEPAALGRRIASTRALAGLNSNQLAARLGVKPNTVSRWENGHATPSRANLQLLASELGVDPEFILGERVEQSKSRDVVGDAELGIRNSRGYWVTYPARYMVCPICGEGGIPDGQVHAHILGSDCDWARLDEPLKVEDAEGRAEAATPDPIPWAFKIQLEAAKLLAMRERLKRLGAESLESFQAAMRLKETRLEQIKDADFAEWAVLSQEDDPYIEENTISPAPRSCPEPVTRGSLARSFLRLVR